MPSYKDSPKPLRKSDPNPLFKGGNDDYIVKAMSPIEQQRYADGSLHSMNRRSSVQAPGIDESLYLGDDKMDKSVEAQATREDIAPDEVLKAYMEKGISGPPAPHMPPVGKSEDEDEEDEEKSMATGSKVVNTAASLVPSAAKKPA